MMTFFNSIFLIFLIQNFLKKKITLTENSKLHYLIKITPIYPTTSALLYNRLHLQVFALIILL